MSVIKNKSRTVARVAQYVAGMKKRYPNGSQKLTMGGGAITITVDELLQDLQGFLAGRAAVTEAQAIAKAKIAAERAQMPALLALLSALEAYIRFTFGADPTALADFGVKPHKAAAPMTTEQKAIAAAKRKATREARGTKSAKAKKAVHGNVDAKLVVTPVTVVDAAAPTAAPAPAPAAAAPNGAAATTPKS